ncbi:hypothetical protein MLD38_013378 [Melastoma candidum]|uniref:Uncharacterized protein n=1 Tax=Melastoma candidum TaxID=119954 RepID=A0ACB9R9G5_9MYRT|nr:hypothetical protein MLD38_013378 [Melastoma candidum]
MGDRALCAATTPPLLSFSSKHTPPLPWGKSLRVSPLPSGPNTRTKNHSMVVLADLSPLTTTLPVLLPHLPGNHSSEFLLLADTTAGYSLASYYTSLGLFVISVPGLWSLIKRSVKSKIVQRTFLRQGEEKASSPSRVAGEILSFFTRNNFVVSDRGETITFKGTMVPNRGQAALLALCTCISLASVALVLTITFPDLGNNWFWITVLSPLARPGRNRSR